MARSSSTRPDATTRPRPSHTIAAISNRHTLTTEWTTASASLAAGDDFVRYRDVTEDTAYPDVRLAAGRAFLSAARSGGLTAAATAAHRRDHGTGDPVALEGNREVLGPVEDEPWADAAEVLERPRAGPPSAPRGGAVHCMHCGAISPKWGRHGDTLRKQESAPTRQGGTS
jgi:hypothetical protein